MNGQRKISNRLWPQTESDLLYQRKDVDGTAFTDRFSEIDLRVDAKQFWIQYPCALELIMKKQKKKNPILGIFLLI